MLIFFGEYMLGRVERMGPSYIATRFAHVWFLPMGPASSWAVAQDYGGGRFQGFRIRTYWRSVLAGYARVWSIVLALLFGGLALSQLADTHPSAVAVLILALLSGGLFVGGLFAHVRFGKLSIDEKALRIVYADWVGAYVDPALLVPEHQHQLWATIAQFLADRAPETGAYRPGTQRPADWADIALHDFTEDIRFIAAALVLARIRGALERGQERARMRRVHADLWAKLRRLDSRCLEWAEQTD